MVVVEAPNAADWMQGWGAIISLPLSLLAVLFTGWLLRHEIRVRREESAAKEATQAQMVRILRVERRTDRTIGLTVWNGSAEPIYSVHVEDCAEDHVDHDNIKVLADRLDGGEEVAASLDLHRDQDVGFGIDVDIVPIPFLYFEDAEGRSWVRRFNAPPRQWDPVSSYEPKSFRALLREYSQTRRPARPRFVMVQDQRSPLRRWLEYKIETNKARNERQALGQKIDPDKVRYRRK